MITYEVTAVVEDGVAASYARWMRDEHIPDVLSTGLFAGAAFEQSAPGRFRVRYTLADEVTLDRYLTGHAPEKRARFHERYPDGVQLSREVWTSVEEWNAAR